MTKLKSLCVVGMIAFSGAMATTMQAQTVSRKFNSQPLKTVLHEIERQTKMSVIVNDVNLDHRVTANFKNTPLREVLNRVLDKSCEYEIADQIITIHPRRKSKPTTKSQSSKQQQGSAKYKLTGCVVDGNGEPIIGASIAEKGTTNVTVTDIDGNFVLNASQSTATVTITYVGFNTKQEKLTSGRTAKITLTEDSHLLDELVVVGYGSSKKRDLIASVSTVKADEMSNLPVANIAQGLAGRSPGLIVQASGGGINSTPTISIRGGGDPLYVIDGVVRSSVDFQNLSPDDIESMSILKDASATAIYGSRASNGIVQVVTKRGKSGKVSIDYDFNMSFSQPSIWPEKMHSYERAEWANVAKTNDLMNGLESPVYSAEAIQKMRDGSDPLNFSDTNWRKLVLKDWAPQSKHTVRLTGGNDIHQFYMSVGHIDQNSLYRSNNHWMKRTTFRFTESATIKAIGLQVNTAIDGYRQHQEHPYTSTSSGYYQVFSHINDRSPLLPGVNKFGLPYNVGDNPVAETASDAGYTRSIVNIINGKGELVWSCLWVDGLKVRLASSYRYYGETYKNWRKDAAQYDWDSDVAQYANKPQLSHTSGTGYSYTNQAFVEYANTFGQHNISALGGFEQYYQKGESYSASRSGYDFAIDQMGVGPANDQLNGGSESELGRAAWIGQLKYNYANKYYAEGSIRYDGSDYFAPGHRWGAFFSGALGWVITEEKFMKSLVEKNIFNSLKLRASYGQTGLDSSAGRFAYLTSYSLNNQAYVINGKYVPGFSEGSLPSPDLTWYTTRQTDIGFDFASLNNRLYGSFDYFYYSTKGYLQSPTGESYLNTSIGIGLPRVKSDSEFRREGWELQLGWRSNVGDLKYDISGNFLRPALGFEPQRERVFIHESLHPSAAEEGLLRCNAQESRLLQECRRCIEQPGLC